jgi:hypothetical protein
VNLGLVAQPPTTRPDRITLELQVAANPVDLHLRKHALICVLRVQDFQLSFGQRSTMIPVCKELGGFWSIFLKNINQAYDFVLPLADERTSMRQTALGASIKPAEKQPGTTLPRQETEWKAMLTTETKKERGPQMRMLSGQMNATKQAEAERGTKEKKVTATRGARPVEEAAPVKEAAWVERVPQKQQLNAANEAAGKSAAVERKVPKSTNQTFQKTSVFLL